MGSAALAAGFTSALIELPLRRCRRIRAACDIILSDERRAGIVERYVSAGVVSVKVRVDDEAHGLVRNFQFLQRGLDFFRQRSELVVHNDDAVFADRSRNVSSLAFQHVDIAGNLGRL